MKTASSSPKLSIAALLVTLGIIYGDIGTSPLYVFRAIAGSEEISTELIYGAFSCVFWILTLETTLKYVLLTLRADNNGEGGIFSLYALVRRRKRWLLFPAIIGGAMLLVEGVITPAISVSSAIEGLRLLYPNFPTVPVVLAILIALFSVQALGTARLGVSFGPIMLVWFLMLGVLGLLQVLQVPSVLFALNPYYAFQLLVAHPGGFWLLGAVFLSTTGVEALYSDLGHCGLRNIRISWGFVKACLLLNYAGQAAWLSTLEGQHLGDRIPFYSLMPDWFLIPGIIIATLATIIASQALISGSFTLVGEAMRLNLFPKLRIIYPTELRGQNYIPAINWLLLVGCCATVLYFRESSNMEAAYGLAINTTLLMTTTLMLFFLIKAGFSRWFIISFGCIYYFVELGFYLANLSKFPHGGWVAICLGGLLAFIMWAWNTGSRLNNRFTERIPFDEYIPILKGLSSDLSVPKYCTHLVYLTSIEDPTQLDANTLYSIMRKQPKRADTYWFLHVDVVDEPYRTEYKVTTLVPEKVFRVDFYLGFRVEARINLLFRKVLSELSQTREVDILSRYQSLRKSAISGDFRFVVMEKFLSREGAMSLADRIVMSVYFFVLKALSISTEAFFGLDTSVVTKEKVPLIIAPLKKFDLHRIE